MENSSNHYDLVIIGGGINGTAIALEASARGLKTLLCEKGDLASGTSSASTKLIHGGLRYLASYEFSLVQASLRDRNNLTKFAQHLVKPLDFYIPFKHKNSTYWKTKIGLWLYRHIAKPIAQPIAHPIAQPKHPFLNSESNDFLHFQDCYTDDARLVIANAKKAESLGAQIKTYTQLISAQKIQNHWALILQNQLSPTPPETIHTSLVINASGPWVETIHTKLFQCKSNFKLQLIQGSHLLFPKLYEGNHAYLLPTQDNRIIFIIPYLTQFSMIGTTDLALETNIKNNTKFQLTQKEIDYLIQEVNPYLSEKINATQIIHHWSGARALPIRLGDSAQKSTANPSKISREVQLEWCETDKNGPYLLSVWGGKLTTHRSLAINAINMLSTKIKLTYASKIYSHYLNSTNNQPVDLSNLLSAYDFLPQSLKSRLVFSYGQDCLFFLKNCTQLSDLGKHFGQDLYEAEINYLIHHEWAKSLDDILYRRTKMGFLLTQAEQMRLHAWLKP